MRRRAIEAAGRALVACGLLSASLVMAATVASGAVSTPFYVAASHSTDIGNTCTNSSLPCATISHALAEQALLNPAAVGNVIEVARGTYVDVAITPTTANANVTIEGASLRKTVINITGSPPALVDLSATTGVTIAKLQIHGDATAEGVLGSSSSGSSNTLSAVDVRGQAPIGIAATGNGTGASTVLTKIELTPADCAAKSLTVVPAGWSAPINVRLNRLPACARGFTEVYINGIGYDASPSAARKTIVLTSGAGAAIAYGVGVVFSTSVPAFTSQGIVCSGAESCAVSGATIVDDVASMSTEGIVVADGATATLSGNSLSGNIDSSVGIDLAPTMVGSTSALPGNVAAGNTSCSAPPNTVTGYGVGVLVAGDTNTADTAVGTPTISVTDNVVSATGTGIVATDDVAGAAAGDVNLTVACNSVSDAVAGTGTGIDLEGSEGERFGGAVSTFGNTVRNTAMGMTVLPCTSCAPVVESTGNLIAHNVIGTSSTSANADLGVLIGGLSTPPEFGGPYPDQTGNTFFSNKWVGNGLAPGVFGANVLDGSGDSANAAEACTCALGSPGLAAGRVPMSIPVTNSGTSMVLAQGTIITVGGASYGDDVAPSVGNEAEFYVDANQALPGNPGGVTTDIGVTELFVGQGQADTPFAIINPGSVVSLFTLDTASSANSYSGTNSCTPDLGGSPTLSAGSSTPAPGYDAC